MNYLEQYETLIAQAAARGWTKKTAPCYVEIHHIQPRCLGGSDDKSNLVALTAQEHYESHRLLALAHPKVWGLQDAWWNFCIRKADDGAEYHVSADDYAAARKAHAEANRVRNVGFKHTEEYKADLSERNRIYDDETEQGICADYLNGLSGHKLRHKYELSTGGLYGLLERNGVQRRTVSESKGGLSEEEQLEVVELYTVDMMSANAIGQLIGRNDQIVRNTLLKHGVTLRGIAESRHTGKQYITPDGNAHKSIKLAAESMGVVFSTMEKRYADLDKVFHRTGRGVTKGMVGKSWRMLGYRIEENKAA